MEEARAEAMQMALDAGAKTESIQVVDIDEVPVAYIPGGSVRIRVKVAGELDLAKVKGADA